MSSTLMKLYEEAISARTPVSEAEEDRAHPNVEAFAASVEKLLGVKWKTSDVPPQPNPNDSKIYDLGFEGPMYTVFAGTTDQGKTWRLHLAPKRNVIAGSAKDVLSTAKKLHGIIKTMKTGDSVA